MNAQALARAPESAPQSIQAVHGRMTVGALLAALATLALGLVAPPLALLCAAMAGANALMRRDGARLHLSLIGLGGPALAAAIVGFLWGLDGAMGVLLVWRIWADARWSYAEARRLKAGAPREGLIASLSIWSTPAFGLTMAAYTAPHVLAGLPLDLPHAPALVPIIAGVAAAALLFDWTLGRLVEWRLGTLAHASAMHLAAHHALFLAAYVISPDISSGLTALIVWRLMHAGARQVSSHQASLTAVP